MIIASESKAIELAKTLLQEPSYQHQEHEFLLSTIETILCGYQLKLGQITMT